MYELLSPLEGIILILLAVVWGAAYFNGMRRGTPNEDRSRRLGRPARLAMITVVLAVGLLWLRHALGTGAALYAWLVVGGLIAGAVGDLLMAGIFPARRPELLGMAVFGVGHAFYLAAILNARSHLVMRSGLPFLAAMVAGAAVVTVIWLVAIRGVGRGAALNAGSLAYGVLLGAATAAAAVTWFASGMLATLAVGLMLFLLSDVLLARYLVRRQGFPFVRDVVWLVYSLGQVLIALSIGPAIVAFG